MLVQAPAQGTDHPRLDVQAQKSSLWSDHPARLDGKVAYARPQLQHRVAGLETELLQGRALRVYQRPKRVFQFAGLTERHRAAPRMPLPQPLDHVYEQKAPGGQQGNQEDLHDSHGQSPSIMAAGHGLSSAAA